MAATHLVVGMPYGCAFGGPGEQEYCYITLARGGADLGRLVVRDWRERRDYQGPGAFPLCRVDDRYFDSDDIDRDPPHTLKTMAAELGGRLVVVSDAAHEAGASKNMYNTPVTVSLVGFPAGVTPAAVLAAAGAEADPAGRTWIDWLGNPADSDSDASSSASSGASSDDEDPRAALLLRIWRAAASL